MTENRDHEHPKADEQDRPQRPPRTDRPSQRDLVRLSLLLRPDPDPER